LCRHRAGVLCFGPAFFFDVATCTVVFVDDFDAVADFFAGALDAVRDRFART
jgi:hypothetical protein